MSKILALSVYHQDGAALIQREWVCVPDDPGVVVAKVNRFGFVGRGFKPGFIGSRI